MSVLGKSTDWISQAESHECPVPSNELTRLNDPWVIMCIYVQKASARFSGSRLCPYASFGGGFTIGIGGRLCNVIVCGFVIVIGGGFGIVISGGIHWNMHLAGKRKISATLAGKLGKFFGISPSIFIQV